LLLLGQVSAVVNLGGIGGGSAASHVRFYFKYGLLVGSTVGLTDIDALVCRTQDYLLSVLNNNEYVDLNLDVKATAIDWEAPRDGQPALLNFTADVTGVNGIEAPGVNKLIEAWGQLSMESYLNDVVRLPTCPSAFSQTMDASFTSSPSPAKTTEYMTASCQSSCAPTVSPGMPSRKFS